MRRGHRRRRREGQPDLGAAGRGDPSTPAARGVLSAATPTGGDLPEALARLDDFIDHERWGSGISAGRIEGVSLAPMTALMATLGDPHRAYPVIHVTGTNGKGSVAVMISRLLLAGGLNVGTYLSPHLERVNERICIGGTAIADADLAAAIEDVLITEPLWNAAPSWFELVTATAFNAFAHHAVDVAVVEVGLLGRFDATNVVTADVAVITSIGPDHTDFTSGWREHVAWEKAGIITQGAPVVLGPIQSDLRPIIDAEDPGRVAEYGVDFEVVDDRVAVGGHMVALASPFSHYEEVQIPLHGARQGVNAAVAVAATELFFGRELDDDVVHEAFAGIELPARCEVLAHHPLVLLDGAHNADAAEALVETLRDEFRPAGARVLIVGVLAGRRPEHLLRSLAEFQFDVVICTTPPSERALTAVDLARTARHLGLEPEVIDDPALAVRRVLNRVSDDDLVVIAGSFYLAAPVRRVVASMTA